MYSIKELLSRRWEFYLLVSLGGTLILLASLDVVPLDTLMAGIAALIVLLALSIYRIQAQNQSDVQRVLSGIEAQESSAKAFLKEDRTVLSLLSERLRSALEVDMLLVADPLVLYSNFDTLSEIAHSNGKIRICYADPSHLLATSTVESEKRLEEWREQIRLSYRRFENFADTSLAKASIQIRVASTIPSTQLIILDRHRSDSIMFVTLVGITVPISTQRSTRNKLSFILRLEQDEKWFWNLNQEFERLWDEAVAIESATTSFS